MGEPLLNGHSEPADDRFDRPAPQTVGFQWLASRGLARVAAAVIGLAFLAGIIAFAVYNPGRVGGYNTTAKNFVLPRLGGSGTVSLAGLRGRPTVVNFFASWCTPCTGELPVFATAARRLSQRVNFVEVDARETGDGRAFLARFGLPSPVVAAARDVAGSDTDGLYESLGGAGTMPVTAFYDSEGKLLATHTGVYGGDGLNAELAQVIGSYSR